MTEHPFRIPLTQGLFALVDEEDFEWLMQWKWCVLTLKHTRYAKRTLKGIMMHRGIMLRYTFGFECVDHANHDGLDNRKANLRACSFSENSANTFKSRGKSRYKGVHFEAQTQRWRPEIRHDGSRLRGPRFDSELEAAAWYDEKAWELFGDFAVLNGVR